MMKCDKSSRVTRRLAIQIHQLTSHCLLATTARRRSNTYIQNCVLNSSLFLSAISLITTRYLYIVAVTFTVFIWGSHKSVLCLTFSFAFRWRNDFKGSMSLLSIWSYIPSITATWPFTNVDTDITCFPTSTHVGPGRCRHKHDTLTRNEGPNHIGRTNWTCGSDGRN